MVLDAAQIHTGQLADGATYDLYVPPTYDGRHAFRVLVSVLPVEPSVPRYLAVELFRDYATTHRRLVLAPRFDFESGFQFLGIGKPVRHDLGLLRMVEAVAGRHTVENDRFDLFGYSAGGQFAHRFLYLHRERLRTVAVGGLGTVTLPSMTDPWPAGLADLREVAGTDADLTPERWPRILLFIGDQDVTLEYVNTSAWANRSGRTRLDRARTLHAAWLASGIPHTYVEVPGMGHEDLVTQDAPMKAVWQFLGER